MPIPLGNPGEWVRTDDYPAQALREKIEGITSFRLDVGRDGRAAACTVTVSSGSIVLDDTTCRLIAERALFTPARDRKGKAVAGQFASRVRWVIPKDGPMLEPGFSSITALVAPDGTVSDCRVEAAEGAATREIKVGPAARCPFNPSHGFTDPAGRPVTKRLRLTVRVEVLDYPGDAPGK